MSAEVCTHDVFLSHSSKNKAAALEALKETRG
jgi:hypothetical protein